MKEKEENAYESAKEVYERSLTEAHEIITRAQNPLTALCIIIAILIYIAPKVYEFPQMTLDNLFSLGLFYLTLIATLLCVGLTCYYLMRAFPPGGYNYTVIKGATLVSIISSHEKEQSQAKLIDFYIKASTDNSDKNSVRLEYITKATGTIMLAVAFCFVCGLLYSIISSLAGLNRCC